MKTAKVEPDACPMMNCRGWAAVSQPRVSSIFQYCTMRSWMAHGVSEVCVDRLRVSLLTPPAGRLPPSRAASVSAAAAASSSLRMRACFCRALRCAVGIATKNHKNHQIAPTSTKCTGRGKENLEEKERQAQLFGQSGSKRPLPLLLLLLVKTESRCRL